MKGERQVFFLLFLLFPSVLLLPAVGRGWGGVSAPGGRRTPAALENT